MYRAVITDTLHIVHLKHIRYTNTGFYFLEHSQVLVHCLVGSVSIDNITIIQIVIYIALLRHRLFHHHTQSVCDFMCLSALAVCMLVRLKLYFAHKVQQTSVEDLRDEARQGNRSKIFELNWNPVACLQPLSCTAPQCRNCRGRVECRHGFLAPVGEGRPRTHTPRPTDTGHRCTLTGPSRRSSSCARQPVRRSGSTATGLWWRLGARATNHYLQPIAPIWSSARVLLPG